MNSFGEGVGGDAGPKPRAYPRDQGWPAGEVMLVDGPQQKRSTQAPGLRKKLKI